MSSDSDATSGNDGICRLSQRETASHQPLCMQTVSIGRLKRVQTLKSRRERAGSKSSSQIGATSGWIIKSGEMKESKEPAH